VDMACVIREALVRARPRVSLGRAGTSPSRRRGTRAFLGFRARGARTDDAATPCLAPKIHFIGIGGAGISALAIIALKQGYRVSGSDVRDSAQLEGVREAGANCFIGHDARNVWARRRVDDRLEMDDQLEMDELEMDLPFAVVVSSAVPRENVELAFARTHGVPVYARSTWLERLTRGKDVVAISGTHGKTSTSACVSTVFVDLGFDISAVVGGNVHQFPNSGNARVGEDSLFVVEADEYDEAFLGLAPKVAAVLNLEFDHPDAFADVTAVRATFGRFLSKVRPGGTIVACGDDRDVAVLVSALESRDAAGGAPASRETVTFGFGEGNSWRAVDVVSNERGGCDFQIVNDRGYAAQRVSIASPGNYAVLNALAAFVVAVAVLRDRRPEAFAFPAAAEDVAGETARRPEAGAFRDIAAAVGNHAGVARRLQKIGQTTITGRSGDGKYECHVYDDYAHHPTAVSCVVAAIRQRHGSSRLLVVFQPHTKLRARVMEDAFAEALRAADAVLVTSVFDARPEREAAAAEAGAEGASAREMGERLARAVGAERAEFAATDAEARDAAVRRVESFAETLEARDRKDRREGRASAGKEDGCVVLCLGAGTSFSKLSVSVLADARRSERTRTRNRLGAS